MDNTAGTGWRRMSENTLRDAAMQQCQIAVDAKEGEEQSVGFAMEMAVT